MLSTPPLIARISARDASLQLGLSNKVLSFSYEDVEKGDDLLNISFADPHNTLVDSPQFLENTPWTVQWGFAGKLRPPRKVLVKRPRFRHGELEVECLDKGSNLRLEENWGTAKNKTPAEIITDIAKKHKLTPIIDRELSNIIPFFIFGGMTDWDILEYLRSRAQDHIFRIIDDKLIFQKRKLNEAPIAHYDYTPGRTSRLLSFEILVKDQDNAKALGQTSANSIDPYTHKKVIFKSDESTSPTDNLGDRRLTDGYKTNYLQNLGSILGISIGGGKTTRQTQGQSTGKSLPLPPDEDKKGMENIAKGRRREALLDSVEANFEIAASPDDPFFQSGDLLDIRGIGKKFSGFYKIIKINHDLGNGYVYKMACKRNAVSAAQLTPAVRLSGYINKKQVQGKKTQTVFKEIESTAGPF